MKIRSGSLKSLLRAFIVATHSNTNDCSICRSDMAQHKWAELGRFQLGADRYSHNYESTSSCLYGCFCARWPKRRKPHREMQRRQQFHLYGGRQ